MSSGGSQMAWDSPRKRVNKCARFDIECSAVVDLNLLSASMYCSGAGLAVETKNVLKHFALKKFLKRLKAKCF